MDTKVTKENKEQLLKERARKTKAGEIIRKNHGDEKSRDTRL